MTSADLNAPVPAPAPAESQLPGFNVLIEGPTGTGKTHALGTLVDSGLDVFYLGLENGMESLLGYWTDRGRPVPANLHWHKIKVSDKGFSTMIDNAKRINTMSNEALGKIQDPNKSRYNYYVKILEVLNNFSDQRSNQVFGAVDEWDVDKVLVVDALTGINIAAMSLVVGGKPIKTLVDWGIAMDQVEKLLRSLTEDCRCHFVLLSHIEREVDQVLGGVKLTVGTLGVKLASKIPPMFSDVILSKREGNQFFWSTSDASADLKTRNLPLSEKLKPDFQAIVDKWTSRAYVKE
jgi:hypothetical protein